MEQATDPFPAEEAQRPWVSWYPTLGLPEPTIHPDLVTMADAAVAAGPDRVAVEYFGWKATYGDLDRLSRGFARYLRERGLQTGDRVALYLQTSPHFVIAALGIWRAGGVVVTMNPMYRRGEVAHLLADSGAVGVVSSQAGYRDVVARACDPNAVTITVTTSEIDVLDDPDPRVFAGITEDPIEGTDDLMSVAADFADVSGSSGVDRKEQDAGTAGVDRPQHDCHPAGDDLAVLCYTSGTTGPAKGAMLTHGNLANAVARNSQWLGTGPGSTLFAAAPLFHVVGLVLEFLQGQQTAGRVVMPFRFVPAVVLELFREHRPQFFVAPPTAFSSLMAQPGATAEDFASFTRMFAGGAMLPPAIVEEFERGFGRYINNGYGLTETCGACVFAVPNRPARVDEATQAMSNGVALPTVDVRIIGDDGQPLPVGERGEIQVRGPVVTVGYWNQEEETQAAFRDGWFSTGDVGFFDDEHILYVADRIKDMIVASGFKVWPGEVEQVLLTHASVREAAVVGVPDEYRGETVKAFVILKPGADADPDQLISWCREHLAAYKAPREIEFRDDLPRTISGKILRRELR